jgi:hypothetical protein
MHAPGKAVTGTLRDGVEIEHRNPLPSGAENGPEAAGFHAQCDFFAFNLLQTMTGIPFVNA